MVTTVKTIRPPSLSGPAAVLELNPNILTEASPT